MKRAFHFVFAFLLTAVALVSHADVPGIVCTATDGERTVTFVAPTANFTLDPNQSIHPQLKPNFSAQWSGFLKIERPGNYRLILTDGKNVIGQQTLKSDRGLMPVNLTFDRKPGLAEQQLWWESDFFHPEPVPWYAYVETNTPPEADAAGQMENGRQLLEDRNCVACHRTDNAILHGRSAPDLSDAGDRLKSEWIYHWLAEPRAFHTNAAMPAISLTDQERSDISTFLATLHSSTVPTSSGSALDGHALFDSIGCAACHGNDAASLQGEGSKYKSPAALAEYLRNPLACDASGRMPGLLLTPDEANALSAYLLASKNPAFEQAAPPGDGARGKTVVQTRGCLNCHELRQAGSKVETQLTASPLNAFKSAGGCLAPNPSAHAPNFHLSDAERAALAAFLNSPDISPAPIQDVGRWIAQFQCATCHAWRGPAGASFGRDQEPPALTDAGNKLRRNWIEQVMTTTNRVRPWLKVRMPQYDSQNINGFFDGFAEQAGNTLGEGSIIDNPRVDLADEGMHYIGSDEEGLSCLTCHAFRGEPSHGDLHSPDLTTVDARIRTDWLQRWLFAPSRIAPGTAMPDFFSAKPEMESQKEIYRLLQVLAMGPKMPDPYGWPPDPRIYYIVVSNTPVIQRCFLPDVSPRAIAVGLPGEVSYAFDAVSCQLRYAWTGGFLDAKPTWTWRGGLPPRLLGKRFYIAPSEALRLQTTSPAALTFHGYDLTNGSPRFTYDLGPARVTLLTHVDKNDLICDYEITQAPAPILFQPGPQAAVTAAPAPEHPNAAAWIFPASPHLQFTARIPIR